MRVKPIITAGVILSVLGWIAMMVSFWLPGAIGEALMSTALTLAIPGAVGAVLAWICWEEIESYQPGKKDKPLRCTDCGTKIIGPAGTTLGDQMEDEIMMIDSPPTPIRPVRNDSFDPWKKDR